MCNKKYLMNGCVKMGSNIEDIIKEIESFIPNNDEWYDLEDILEELFSSNNPQLGLNAMISIYEKYPNEDNDVLWGMLHGIEDIQGYELKIIESIKRKPSFFGVLMINRMLNLGITSIQNINLIDILDIAVNSPNATEYVKEQAKRFLQLHLK
jgi:hypothetical protein